jgi:hypothetical protein
MCSSSTEYQQHNSRELHRDNLAVLGVIVSCLTIYTYEGCTNSKERLRIQPAQLFHCTISVIWCVQYSVDSYLVQLVQRTFLRCECNGL